MFVRQSEMLIPEEELGSQSPVSYEEDFEDLSSNVDLYVFNDQMVQGYRAYFGYVYVLVYVVVYVVQSHYRKHY